MMSRNWKNITNSQNSVRKHGGTFSFSNCHIIGLDTGSLVLIVFVMNADLLAQCPTWVLLAKNRLFEPSDKKTCLTKVVDQSILHGVFFINNAYTKTSGIYPEQN
jgi:hypothetical protein